MSNCCNDKADELAHLQAGQRNVLIIVLAINAVLFLVEFAAGLAASSTALLADSLDMLGDALVYGASLYVVTRNDLWKARSASLKGWIMVAFAVLVLAQATWKMLVPQVPDFQIIEIIALVALAGNATCLTLLSRHRADDVNMRSVWLCSRNDIIANVSVLIAGVAVWVFSSQLPDIIVGLGIAALFLRSATQVLREAKATRDAFLADLARSANHHPSSVAG